MNKGEFVDALAEKTGFTKVDARKSLDACKKIISEALENNEEVMLTGFGKWEPRTRKATERINPQTGEKFQVPSKVVPKFKAGKTLKESVAASLKAVGGSSGDLEIKQK